MRATLLFLFVSFSLLASAGSSFAQSYDNPKALVSAIYEPFGRGESPTDFTAFYTEKLKAMFAAQAEKVAASTGVNTGDDASATADVVFNPFVDSQNHLLFDLAIGEPVVLGDNAIVTVSFHNFDHPTLLSIAAVKEADGWKVDDVASIGKDEHWLLSWLLTYDVFGN
jgi:hypothetical protein